MSALKRSSILNSNLWKIVAKTQVVAFRFLLSVDTENIFVYLPHFVFFFLGGGGEEMDWNRVTEAIRLYDTVIIKETLRRTSSLLSKIFAKILFMVKRDDK